MSFSESDSFRSAGSTSGRKFVSFNVTDRRDSEYKSRKSDQKMHTIKLNVYKTVMIN